MRVFLYFAARPISHLPYLVQLLAHRLFLNLRLVDQLLYLVLKVGPLELERQLLPNFLLCLAELLLNLVLQGIVDEIGICLLDIIVDAHDFLLVRTVEHLVLQFDEFGHEDVLL